MNGYENIKAACEPLNGVIASEDLKDRLLVNYNIINLIKNFRHNKHYG